MNAPRPQTGLTSDFTDVHGFNAATIRANPCNPWLRSVVECSICAPRVWAFKALWLVSLLAMVSPAAEPAAVPLPAPTAPAAPALRPSTEPMPLPDAPLNAVQRETAVELPPMIVAESAKAPPWLYAKVGDTEYLSRCSASVTRAYITSQLEIRRVLRVFMPADFLATNAIPNVSIVAPLELRPGDDVANREMMRMEKQTIERGNEEDRRQGRVPALRPVRFLPNLRLDDRDMLAVFTYLDERDFHRQKLIAAPDFVWARLVARTPMLPLWLIEGLSSLYQQASFRDDPITMFAARWVSSEDTAGLRRDAESRRVLLPAGELFNADALMAAPNRHATRIAAWRAQAVLFVRWALDPANAPAAEALWKFARRTSQEPATEAIFVECFGFGYADLLDRLSDYLPTAVRQPARIPTGKLPALPRFDVKPATPAQITRLRGEWERLEIPFVRGKHPEFLPRYIEQARTTLRRAVARGDADPQLFAALGLCELDAGDAGAARPWLEQAAASRVVRPRVHLEVARFRWRDLTSDTGEKSGFTTAQLEPVLEPLRVAMTQSPALPEVYILMADAWLRCKERTRPGDLAALVAATPLFRRLPGLALRVAVLQFDQGQRVEARQLLTAAGEFVHDPAMRTQYDQAFAAMAAPTIATPPKP